MTHEELYMKEPLIAKKIYQDHEPPPHTANSDSMKEKVP
jgi:hypothetical protein